MYFTNLKRVLSNENSVKTAEQNRSAIRGLSSRSVKHVSALRLFTIKFWTVPFWFKWLCEISLSLFTSTKCSWLRILQTMLNISDSLNDGTNDKKSGTMGNIAICVDCAQLRCGHRNGFNLWLFVILYTSLLLLGTFMWPRNARLRSCVVSNCWQPKLSGYVFNIKWRFACTPNWW